MAAVELHVNAIYYAQHPALKSVYGKDQSAIAGSCFPPIGGQCKHSQDLLEIPKQVTLITSISL